MTKRISFSYSAIHILTKIYNFFYWSMSDKEESTEKESSQRLLIYGNNGATEFNYKL